MYWFISSLPSVQRFFMISAASLNKAKFSKKTELHRSVCPLNRILPTSIQGNCLVQSGNNTCKSISQFENIQSRSLFKNEYLNNHSHSLGATLSSGDLVKHLLTVRLVTMNIKNKKQIRFFSLVKELNAIATQFGEKYILLK